MNIKSESTLYIFKLYYVVDKLKVDLIMILLCIPVYQKMTTAFAPKQTYA